MANDFNVHSISANNLSRHVISPWKAQGMQSRTLIEVKEFRSPSKA
jgi:hypothetical protein